jgi:hypothetical protein
VGQPSPVSLPVGHASPEQMDGLVLCLGLSGILSLFCQNKLDDVSLCGWMLQRTPFADGPHSRVSLNIYV